MAVLAYLDPSSGSMIAGFVAAGAATVAVTARSMVHRVRHPFGGRGPAPDPGTAAEGDADPNEPLSDQT